MKNDDVGSDDVNENNKTDNSSSSNIIMKSGNDNASSKSSGTIIGRNNNKLSSNKKAKDDNNTTEYYWTRNIGKNDGIGDVKENVKTDKSNNESISLSSSRSGSRRSSSTSFASMRKEASLTNNDNTDTPSDTNPIINRNSTTRSRMTGRRRMNSRISITKLSQQSICSSKVVNRGNHEKLVSEEEDGDDNEEG